MYERAQILNGVFFLFMQDFYCLVSNQKSG